MKIFYTTFICIFFNVYITKAAKQEPFTIDIYLPIFSCLDEFVAGNLFYPVEEGDEYGTIWKDKGYTEDKQYFTSVQNKNINNAQDLNFYVTTCLGLSWCVSGKSWFSVFLPVYNFEKEKYRLRFFFADTNDFYSPKAVEWAKEIFEFHGNINVFCWLGNIEKPSAQEDNAAPAILNDVNALIVSSGKDLKNIILAKSFEIFICPGGKLNIEDGNPDDEDVGNSADENKNKLEFDNNLFSFVFLGKDPFGDKYKGVFAKENRKGITVVQSEDDIINDKENYFDYFKKKIQSLFELDRIKNFLEKQKDFLGDNTSSAAADIKLLLDNAFVLLKRYSDEGWETQAKVIKEKNCCEKCCENICG